MTKQEFKEWVKKNLEVTIETVNSHSSENSVYVGLRFKDEEQPFCREHLYIPKDPDQV